MKINIMATSITAMAMDLRPTFFSRKKAAPARKLTMTLLRRIMEINKAERHIRGGLATRNRYKGLRP